MSNDRITFTKDFDYNQQQYRLFISYKKDGKQPFQPLYYLDANSQSDLIRANNNETDGATILYVGIGYQDGVDVLAARTRDYTVPAVGEAWAEGGGAEAFYQFLTERVMPWIECRFAVNTNSQTLSGHSHGGQFALYLLFNYPETFQHYVAASPSLWWGDGAPIPAGTLTINKKVRSVNLLIGECEEKVSAFSTPAERARVEMINANPAFKTRNLATRLINNEQRCSFTFCPGRRHGGVIKDYAKIANLVAGQKPQADGL